MIGAYRVARGCSGIGRDGAGSTRGRAADDRQPGRESRCCRRECSDRRDPSVERVLRRGQGRQSEIRHESIVNVLDLAMLAERPAVQSSMELPSTARPLATLDRGSRSSTVRRPAARRDRPAQTAEVLDAPRRRRTPKGIVHRRTSMPEQRVRRAVRPAQNPRLRHRQAVRRVEHVDPHRLAARHAALHVGRAGGGPARVRPTAADLYGESAVILFECAHRAQAVPGQRRCSTCLRMHVEAPPPFAAPRCAPDNAAGARATVILSAPSAKAAGTSGSRARWR